MIRTTLIAITIAALPLSALASGANTKSGIGDKNGQLCEPGFFWDKAENLCVAANWI